MTETAAPAPGATAPPFRLPDSEGQVVTLAELNRASAALVLFFRGWW